MRKKNIYVHIIFLCLLISSRLIAQNNSIQKYPQYQLPNGWNITSLGKTLPLGDLPLNMVVSNSKKKLVVTNNGQSTQTIQLIDLTKNIILDTKIINKAWLGLCFSKNDKSIYVAGGNDNWILKYDIINNKLMLNDSIKLGISMVDNISPTGICIDYKNNNLYVVTKGDNSLYEINLNSKKITQKVQLPDAAYTCILSPNNDKLYISCWGCAKVLEYNIEQHKITNSIEVGSHPNDMCITKNGKYLYVANANDNSVSIINTKSGKVLETLDAAIYPNSLTGSTTNGVSLSADEKSLYIANADNNCLAVFNVENPGQSYSKGYIPTGWYPTAVKVVKNNIFVANGKGYHSFANPLGPNPTINQFEKITHHNETIDSNLIVQYIGGLFKGTLSIIQVPTEIELAEYSQLVYLNTPYSKDFNTKSLIKEPSPIPQKIGDTSPIKYVFYIIKENRTYDQVLSDIPGGNGDTSLLLFGEKYTPNLHKLAKEFVLFDNFYCDGEVSMDGHNWSLGGYATDYIEKTWVTSYGDRGGTYDGEGAKEIANNKHGFLWDYAKRANVTFRTYGEFINNKKPSIPVLENNYCTYYTEFDLSVRDTTRFFQWKKDFDSLLAINKVPQLNTFHLSNDHTEGIKLGRPTPFVHVADNDWAVGMFLEHLSNSSIWKNAVVLIIEDDAQDGPDHVDAHRSTAYLAGPFVKRNYIDHTMYSTTSFLKTIELILGIPHMTQFDAAANSLWRSFTMTPNFKTFKSLEPNISLDDVNTQQNVYQEMSEQFDFSKEDRVKDALLTEVLWKGIKGVNAIVPKPRRAAFLKLNKNKLDDD